MTRERFALADTTVGASPDSLKNNLEGLVSASLNAFAFDAPKLDLFTSLDAYPSISLLSRVRGELAIRVRYEVFKDFYVGLRLSDKFDSRPLETTATDNDAVTTITVGWSYRR